MRDEAANASRLLALSSASQLDISQHDCDRLRDKVNTLSRRLSYRTESAKLARMVQGDNGLALRVRVPFAPYDRIEMPPDAHWIGDMGKLPRE